MTVEGIKVCWALSDDVGLPIGCRLTIFKNVHLQYSRSYRLGAKRKRTKFK